MSANAVYPSKKDQDFIIDCVEEIKLITYLHKEEGLGLFDIFSKNLIECGADSILLACTEFGLPYLEGEIDIFDSSKIYAEEVVRFAKSQ